MAANPTVPVSAPTQQTPSQPTTDPLYPPQLSPGARPADDAPPSYEDAMADDITPVNGPRRDFSGVTDENAPGLDEKGAAPGYTPRQGNVSASGGPGERSTVV